MIVLKENERLYVISWQYNSARIPNAYDSGYHFENIPVKERRIKIDF